MENIRRFLTKFVGKLNENTRIIFLTFVVIFCVVSLSIGIYVQFFYAYNKTDPFMIGMTKSEKKIEQINSLKQQFFDLFDNELLIKDLDEEKVHKMNKEQGIVYTAYDLSNEDEGLYSVNVDIPQININSDIIKKINEEIKLNYYNKTYDIMQTSNENTIYQVSYISYIYSDVMSLVIKSSLKMNNQNEKVSIKTYTYSIKDDKLLNLEDIINIRNFNYNDVQSKIDLEILKSCENSQKLSKEYENIYKRDINNEMYKIENTENYFLSNDGLIYIIYPYGNYDFTNEMDIIIL